MPIGVQGYTLRYRAFTRAQLERTYAKVKEAGYDGVESGMGGRLISDDEDLALLQKNGLKVADIYGDVTKPDELMRRAEKFGVKIAGLMSIPGEMMLSSDGFKAYAEQLNALAKPYKGTGYRLQYHNHAQELRNFPDQGGKAGLAILIEETDPEVVCFELDTYWLSAAGADPAQWILKAKGRIPIVHYKDFAFNNKAQDTGLGSVYPRYAEIGQGNINWQAVTAACREAGSEWYCVEQDQTVLDEFECLKISADYMRGALGIS